MDLQGARPIPWRNDSGVKKLEISIGINVKRGKQELIVRCGSRVEWRRCDVRSRES